MSVKVFIVAVGILFIGWIGGYEAATERRADRADCPTSTRPVVPSDVAVDAGADVMRQPEGGG